MKEYIERAAILKSLGYDEKRRADVLPGSTFDVVLKEPTADVAEVRHGRWSSNGIALVCSECGKSVNLVEMFAHYCPYCGTRMDKEAEHDVD